MENVEIQKIGNVALEKEDLLYCDVCQIIDGAKNRIATYLNTEVCMTNWYVGKRIKEDVLYNQRAQYGRQILGNLSIRLTEKYGSGWSLYKLQHCVRAAYTFSEEEIMYATRTQLTWTHLRTLMSIKDPLERQFYAQMCGIEHSLSEKLRNAIAIAREHYAKEKNEEK